MALLIKCSWCGEILGEKEGTVEGPLSVTHTICPKCEQLLAATPLPASMRPPLWNGVERRSSGERRRRERRVQALLATGTVIIIDGVTWIGLTGTDRRLAVRRENDRERINEKIKKLLKGS